MYKTLLILLVSAFFVASVGATEEDQFSTLDTDQNGAISADEAASSAALTESWQKVDTNADGSVDRAEFSAFEAMEPAASE